MKQKSDKAHGIAQVDNVITAWDTFTQETPGVSERITIDGKDAFSILERFMDLGMYLAEQREKSYNEKMELRAKTAI